MSERIPLSVYLEGSYTEEIVVKHQPDGRTVYVGRYRSMPNCVVQADSEPAALRALRKPYIEKLYNAGHDLPLPDFPPRKKPGATIGSVFLYDDLKPGPPEGQELPPEGTVARLLEEDTVGIEGAAMA